MKTTSITREMFFDEVKSYIKNKDSLKLISDAYDYAFECHKDQKRLSGEMYFTHCLYVAFELAKLHAGPATISAGLLHDVIEDCNVSEEEFINRFGQEVYDLVEAVTKVSRIKYVDDEEFQANNHRKLFIAMANDVRVILIKLVDRLHNMRTLEFQKPEKQKRIAKETLEVYAPIAHRLGIAEIKNELEDLSFYYLDNEKYHEIAHLVESKKSERDQAIHSMIQEISKMLDERKIPYRIFGRSKHLYSINKKMVTKNKRFDEILDLLAIRIVTKNELNCYEILGYIHAKYRPIPGRLKDYIAMPKMNLYRSLHTTIVGEDGRIYEVQIRTEEMDEIAERGIAAHWAYKEKGRSAYNAKTEQKEIVNELEWLKAFEDNQDGSSSDASNYMNTVTNDIFNANVYVMTPKGRVIDLPSGSCPIDFAYRIHTEVGNQTVGSIVNGVLVPLNTRLKTGDVVELKTNKNSSPSEDWLKFVKSSSAKNKIKQYFIKKQEEDRKEEIEQGEALLKEEFKRRELDFDDYYRNKRFDRLFSQFEVSNYNDFCYAIAKKSLSTTAILEKIAIAPKKEMSQEEIQEYANKNKAKVLNRPVSKTGVIVKGIDSMQIKLAPCCCPCKGDEIVGYVTKGQGIKVHRKECPNVIKEGTRLIDVEWDLNDVQSRKYEVNIMIYSKDRNYLLTDLVTIVSQYKANITAVNSVANPEDLTATTNLTIVVDDLEHLNNIIANLKKVESVISVERGIK